MNDEWPCFSDKRFKGPLEPTSVRLLLSCFLGSLAIHVLLLILFWAIAKGAGLSGRGAGSDVAPAAVSAGTSPLQVQIDLRHVGAATSPDVSVQTASVIRETDWPTLRPGDPGGQPKGGIALPLPTYHSSEELTKQPQLAGEIDDSVMNPDPPMLGGSLVLRLYLSETGRVDRVQVMRSTLARDVEGTIVQKFFHARYVAGEIDGVPVLSEMTVAIELGTRPQSANAEPLP